jgi:ribosomal protein S4E
MDVFSLKFGEKTACDSDELITQPSLRYKLPGDIISEHAVFFAQQSTNVTDGRKDGRCYTIWSICFQPLQLAVKTDKLATA